MGLYVEFHCFIGATQGPRDCSNKGVYLKEFSLPVKTIPTIMKELGHTHVDIMKIDVEGSEYALLEHMFDTFGCPPTDQITLEWHHFDFDSRYGTFCVFLHAR